MDLLDLLKLMFRRWYVTVPVIVLTLGAALVLGASIQPEYKTEAAVLLVPPTTATAPAPNASPQPGNPWLRVGENAMAQAVQIAVSAHDARTQVVAAGGDPSYEIGLVNRSSILTIEVTASTHASALATVTSVTKLIEDVVASKQAEYRPRAGEQITTEILDPGLNIIQSRSNVLRAQIVVGAIGLLLATAAAVGYDALQRRRATARQNTQRAARTPLIWNSGQAAVGSRRPSPTVQSHTPSARPRPDATATPAVDARTSIRDTNSPRNAPDPGPPQQSDDTILLSTVRGPVEDSTTP